MFPNISGEAGLGSQLFGRFVEYAEKGLFLIGASVLGLLLVAYLLYGLKQGSVGKVPR